MTPRPFDLDRALAGLGARRRALILPHDNPDPDALAAAEGLRRLLADARGIDAVIAVGGIIGRAENRAMVRTLGLRLERIEELDLADFPIVALVDTQPETGNNSLPPGHPVDIVVDHHPLRPGSGRAPWCDVQPERGATSALVYGYLARRAVTLDAALATAFLYALKTETRDLGREAGDEERRMYVELLPAADLLRLDRIVNPKVPREHFATLDRALRAARVHGPLVAVEIGALDYPDLVAEIADLLLPLDRVHWVLCVGQYRGAVHLSLRSDLPEAHAGELIRTLVGGRGAAGGHGMVAGGRLHAPVGDGAELHAIHEELVVRICGLLQIAELAGAPLIGLEEP